MAVAVNLGNPNMGPIDRLIRGALGGWMVVNGLAGFGRSPVRRAQTLLGVAWLSGSLLGRDPLFKLFGLSSVQGREDFLLNQLRQAAPGQGINPMLTQQPTPQHSTRGVGAEQSVAEATRIH
jgi:hypothetical protein